MPTAIIGDRIARECILKAWLVKFLYAATLVFAVAGAPVWAHGADDHEHAAPVAAAVAIAPRASAQTEDFEMVLVWQGKNLLIYLDRFADNTPVVGASLEVELSGAGAFKAAAKQSAPGEYRVELTKAAQEALQKPGKYPFSISVQAGELGDVMTVSLEIPDPAVDEHDHPESHAWLWWSAGGAGGLLLLAMGIWLRRKSKLDLAMGVK